MQNRRTAAVGAAQMQDFQGEMRRRIAGCRERLRRNRSAQRITERCVAPAQGRATGASAIASPAHEAHGKESGREG